MKKITSKEPISFRVDGNTLLEIDSKGCITDDESAAIALERLGKQIVVTESSVKSSLSDAEKELKKEEEKAAKEAEKAAKKAVKEAEEAAKKEAEDLK